MEVVGTVLVYTTSMSGIRDEEKKRTDETVTNQCWLWWHWQQDVQVESRHRMHHMHHMHHQDILFSEIAGRLSPALSSDWSLLAIYLT